MDEIQEAISAHKKDCQELQQEKFRNIENTLERMEENINIMLKQNNRNVVLETRLNIIEEALNKRTDKAISIISFAISILLALYILIPKLAQ